MKNDAQNITIINFIYVRNIDPQTNLIYTGAGKANWSTPIGPKLENQPLQIKNHKNAQTT